MYFFGSAADPMVLKMISWYSNNGHLSYSETDVGTPIITRVRVPNKEKLCCVWKNLIEYKYVLVLWRRSVHFRSGSQMHMIPPHNSMKITEMFFSIHVIEKIDWNTNRQLLFSMIRLSNHGFFDDAFAFSNIQILNT